MSTRTEETPSGENSAPPTLPVTINNGIPSLDNINVSSSELLPTISDSMDGDKHNNVVMSSSQCHDVSFSSPSFKDNNDTGNYNQNTQSIDKVSDGSYNGNSSSSENSFHAPLSETQLQQQQLQQFINTSLMQQHQQFMKQPNIFMPRLYRKGKWAQEEEDFTRALINAFNNGYLAIPIGTTLRSFLSEKLNCDPMRITKKFTGDHSIGKQMYQPTRDADPEIVARTQAELKDLEAKFIVTVEPKGKHAAMPAEFLAAPHLLSHLVHAHAANLGVGVPGVSPSLLNSGVPHVNPAAAAAAAATANMYRQQAAMSSGSLHSMVPPVMGSVLNHGGGGSTTSSDEDNINPSNSDPVTSNPTLNESNDSTYIPMLPAEQSTLSVNEQMAKLTSSVPPVDMNVFFAQYQMEALAQAKAYAIAQAHAYESYAVEQAQKNDYSDTYKQKRGNAIYPSNDSDSSGGGKEKFEEKIIEDRMQEADKTEAKDSELLLNFFEASKNSAIVHPMQGIYNFTGLPTLSQETIHAHRVNSSSADVTSKEDSSHDSNNSGNNASDTSDPNERDMESSDVSESSSDVDNNAPNSSSSDTNSTDTPPQVENRDDVNSHNANEKRNSNILLGDVEERNVSFKKQKATIV